MKYYILEAQPHVPQPQFRGWHSVLPPKKFQTGEIPRISSFQVELPKDMEFMDVVTHPYFMISKEFYQLVWMFDEEIKFKFAILTDVQNKRRCLFGIPLLEVVDCLTPDSEFNMDKSILKRSVLRREAIEGRALFRIDGVESQYIAASLELVESAYRREVLGLKVKEVEVV